MRTLHGYVVAVGEPFDAIEFYGPFEDNDEAIEYADTHRRHASWWVKAVFSDLARIPEIEEDDERECVYVVGLGSPFVGYTLYGFFNDFEECEEWVAASRLGDLGPWFLRVESPS